MKIREMNKQQKRESLLESAFSLFIAHGFGKTSIADIVGHAGVAKGTFYLYFKDKYDIRNHLITYKASQLFISACEELAAHPEIIGFEDQVLFIIDKILDCFEAEPKLLVLLSKHLSWALFKNSISQSADSETPAVREIFLNMFRQSEVAYRDPEYMIFMILELTSGISYNTILYGSPASLGELKPHLYRTVRGIFEQFRDE